MPLGSVTHLEDERTQTYIVRDKRGRTLFTGSLHTPRYVAGLDLDADNDLDLIVDSAAYGNHGNGREIYEVLLNDGDRLVRLENPLSFREVNGQETRAGRLTWCSI